MFKDIKGGEHVSRKEMALHNLKHRLVQCIAVNGNRSPGEMLQMAKEKRLEFGPTYAQDILRQGYERDGPLGLFGAMMMAMDVAEIETGVLKHWITKNPVLLEGLVQDYMNDMREETKSPV